MQVEGERDGESKGGDAHTGVGLTLVGQAVRFAEAHLAVGAPGAGRRAATVNVCLAVVLDAVAAARGRRWRLACAGRTRRAPLGAAGLEAWAPGALSAAACLAARGYLAEVCLGATASAAACQPTYRKYQRSAENVLLHLRKVAVITGNRWPPRPGRLAAAWKAGGLAAWATSAAFAVRSPGARPSALLRLASARCAVSSASTLPRRWSTLGVVATGGESFLYLTTTGRLSGLPRRIEIWFVELSAKYYLVSEMRGESRWVKNVMADPLVTFSVGTREDEGRDMPPGQARARLVEPRAEAELSRRVCAAMDEKYNWSDGLIVEIAPID
jgi:hypothetical protein